MPNRTLSLQQETFYHIYNRGCDKQQLFFEDRDYRRFLENVLRFQEPCPYIHIPAWCVLPNHFHFLLIESSELDSYPLRDTNLKKNKEQDLLSDLRPAQQISRFMQKLQQAYAAFFNTKYMGVVKEKKGPVFEGRFRVSEIPDDGYLAHLKDYIEYNPVKHGLVKKVEDWEYSSFDQDVLDSFTIDLDSYPKDTNPRKRYDFGSFDPFFD